MEKVTDSTNIPARHADGNYDITDANGHTYRTEIARVSLPLHPVSSEEHHRNLSRKKWTFKGQEIKANAADVLDYIANCITWARDDLNDADYHLSEMYSTIWDFQRASGRTQQDRDTNPLEDIFQKETADDDV